MEAKKEAQRRIKIWYKANVCGDKDKIKFIGWTKTSSISEVLSMVIYNPTGQELARGVFKLQLEKR
ncbi:hypothetical protein D3C71_2150990 [compost metagenome]